jgi:hypothetical protein
MANIRMKTWNKPGAEDQDDIPVLSEAAGTGPRDKMDELVDRLLAGQQGLGRTLNTKGEMVTMPRSKVKSEIVAFPFTEGVASLGDKNVDALRLKATAVRNALLSGSEELKEEALNAILGDLVIGAYQDKLAAYLFTATDRACGDLDKAGLVQARRHAADRHLIQVLKAVQDIRRPPVKVVIKEAKQVNVAHQINAAEKQVNLPPGRSLP